MGLGDCQRACEYGAITICNGLARVDPGKCKGCSKCVAACPKGIISLVPLKKQAVVRCSSCDKAKGTMAVCSIGCIGCGKCAESCPQHTIHIQDKKAVIDYTKCIRCYCCHEMCPQHVIDIRRLPLFRL